MSLWRALPPLLPALAACALLLVGEIRVPGHRGAARLGEGFEPAAWDARYRVARGPAALVLPREALTVWAELEGPARVELKTSPGRFGLRLTGGVQRIPIALPEGGRAELRPDFPIRLHGLAVMRDSGRPWSRLGLALLGAAVGVSGAVLARGAAGRLAATVLAWLAAGVALYGGFPGLLVQALADRLAPAAAVAGLALAFTLLLALPRGEGEATPVAPLALPFGLLALVSCLVQVLWAPQPLLAGEPGEYYAIGGRFAGELAGVRGPDSLADAMQQLRPYGEHLVTGLLYGAVRAVHDAPVAVYVTHALAMALAIGLLVAAAVRLGGAPLGVLTGLLALLYPTFPVVCGVVRPVPVVLLLWCAALERLARAGEQESLRGYGLAGTAFALGLLLTGPGAGLALGVLAVLLLPLLPRLLGPSLRAGTLAFVLGLLPVLAVSAAASAWAAPVTRVLAERHGFEAYASRVPRGFWLYLDSDGWPGPRPVARTRFARELRAAERAGEVEGGLGRLAFAARFVAAEPAASVRAVLRNVHRLLDRPDNPLRRSWIVGYGLSVWWHRAVVVLALLAVPICLQGTAAPVLAPIAVASVIYPLGHPSPHHAGLIAPFLLLAAAIALEHVVARWPRGLLAALFAAAVGALLTPAALVLDGADQGMARGFVRLLHVGGLVAAFATVAVSWGRRGLARAGALVAGAVLVAATVAALWGDPGWRDLAVPLREGAQHTVRLAPEDLLRLNRAREAFVMLDLELPGGDPAPLALRFWSGLELSGAALRPTMPDYPLATRRLLREPEVLPQWWALPWRPDMVRGEVFRVELSARGPGRLRGQLAAADEVPETALSLGQWPYRSAQRLLYEDEYRLPAPQSLAGSGRSSEWGGLERPAILGVRLVVLDRDAGGARWVTAPAPPDAGEVVTAIWARVGGAARAELHLPGGRLRLNLADPGDVAGAAGEVRFRATGASEGWFWIRTLAAPGEPLELAVRPFHELSHEPKYFLPELGRARPPVPSEWRHLPFVPPERVLEARRAPRWKPAVVY